LSQRAATGGEPSEQEPKTTQKKRKKPSRIVGRLPDVKKPPAESSGAAAEDMLRDYLRRRR
jgi:hypothetical protein